MGSRQWKYQVVKSMRGVDGRMFRLLPARTFDEAAEARANAEEFAAEQAQAGVYGAVIEVRERVGDRLLESWTVRGRAEGLRHWTVAELR